MRRTSLLLALLVFCPVLSQCIPLYVLTAPNLLRVESEENAVVEAHNINADLKVEVRLQFFPKNNEIIFRKEAVLSAGNGHQVSVPIQIPKDRIPKETRSTQYVVLEASSTAFNLEKLIRISYKTGHIFIQTDKPIYTPAQTVLYRLLTVDNELKPTKRTIIVDFVNPQDVVVQRDEVFAKDATGMTGSTFKIPEIVNIGVWKIAASYKEASHVNFTTEFEVKEYVLPSFEVILESDKHFFYVDDQRLDVSITARFTYGKPVEGRAFVLFGIMKDGEKIGISSSLKSVAIKDGQGAAFLTSEALKETFPNVHELVGCSIYVAVSVITHTGSDIVEAEKSGIKIVTSPYSILFTKTSKYYKPGMPFDLMVYVTNPDGSPASGVPVIVNNGQSRSRTQADGRARLTINTVGQPQNIPVKVETDVPNIPKDRQASASMVAEPYMTQDGSTNYLHIGIQPTVLSPGNNLVVHLNLRNDNAQIQNQIKYFTYMLINKGKIVTVGRQPRLIGQIVVNMLIPITRNLIPSFRLLVYYYVTKGAKIEMVADSVWVDVKDTCMGTLVVSAANNYDENKIYKPGRRFQLKITGDSGARVGVVAVDKAVFILNKKNKLTQSKIWSVVEKSDIGCTPGSGNNVLGVFADAGLALVTSTDLKTATRTELQCKQPMKRKRRSTTLMEVRAAKLNEYKMELERRCCRDGMKRNLMGYSCKKRVSRISFNGKCKAAFLDCCHHFLKSKAALRGAEMTLARSDDDDYYSPYEDITSRSDFPESWLWLLITLPSNGGAGDVTKDLSGYLKDSITTWEIQAVSVSSDKGICVAQPYELTVQKEFFIDLRLPYSVVRNEQVEIRAILYNYDEEDIRVRVEIPFNENICSGAKPNHRLKQTVIVPKKGSIAVPYVIVPLNIGEVVIEVKASVYDRLVTDGVRKTLLVVPEGKKIERPVQTYDLDPQGHEQVIKVDLKVPDDVVPNTEPLTFISVQGDLLAETIENSIDGTKLNHLIRVPSGCGEQNLASMTPGVIVTNFLDKTQQWEKLGMDRRETSLKNIKQGYIQQLAYRKPESSFASYPNRDGSTWLTAYVVKVFAMSFNLIAIEPDVLCGAVKWLILNKQKPGGQFKEDAPVIHGQLTGGYLESQSEVTLTAFVLIAMLEAKSVCSFYIESYENSVRKAGDYLENHIGNLKRTYAVAVTTYALSLLQKDKIDILMKFASADQSYWADDGKVNSLYTIEATGYALLALTQLRRFEQAGKLVKWLSQKSEYGGGFQTTQATMVALQGLANYRADIPEFKEINLDVVVTITGRQNPIPWHFGSSNSFVSKSERMSAKERFTVKASGHGQGTLKVVSSYYALLSRKVKECKKFDLQVTVQAVAPDERPENAVNSVLLKICARKLYPPAPSPLMYEELMDFIVTYLDQSSSSMAIADISMLTGFSPDIQDLNLLKDGVDKYISRFELDKALSTRGSLIVYLDSVSNIEDTCFGFKVHQFFKVGLIQPASVKIYEYYDPENSCTKFYHVNESSSMLSKICQGDVCKCAEGSCILVKLVEQRISDQDREDKACAPGIDYVYKVTFQEKKKEDSYFYYKMKILTVIKQGSDPVVNEDFRTLITHANCEETFHVDLGKDYLIMGEGTDLWYDGERISYLIGGETWMEFWPKEVECQQRVYSRLCQDLVAFSETLMINGCGT